MSNAFEKDVLFENLVEFIANHGCASDEEDGKLADKLADYLIEAHQSELQDAVREARITELKKVPTDGPGDPTGEYITERITYLTQKEIS